MNQVNQERARENLVTRLMLEQGAEIITSDKQFKTAIDMHEKATAFFIADWCVPCKMLVDQLKRTSEFKDYVESNGVYILAVDIEDLRLTANRSIRGVPKIRVYNSGTISKCLNGLEDTSKLIKTLQIAYSH